MPKRVAGSGTAQTSKLTASLAKASILKLSKDAQALQWEDVLKPSVNRHGAGTAPILNRGTELLDYHVTDVVLEGPMRKLLSYTKA